MNSTSSVLLLIYLAIAIAELAAVWILFTKAGRPGWACLIPFYNTYVILKITGHSGWWILGFFVPLLNFVLYIILAIDLARSFGRGTGFGIGILLLSPIFIPILAFGDSRYLGPVAGGNRPALA